MSFDRPLRGSCHCGRNLYIIQLPQSPAHQTAQVLFTSQPSQAYLRVPLPWYHSLTLPLNETETRSQIHRAYTTTAATTPKRQQQHYQQEQQQEEEEEKEQEERTTKMRHFCGFCGTPLSYWSEHDADFIQLSLGSLVPRDLADLEELGFLPASSSGSEGEEEGGGGEQPRRTQPRHERGQGQEGLGGQEEVVVMGRVGAVPWFDGLVEGSRLGRVCREAAGVGEGRVRVEWEVVEWTEEEEGDGGGGASPRKRKLGEV